MPHDQTIGTKKHKCNSLLQLLQNHQFHVSLCIMLINARCLQLLHCATEATLNLPKATYHVSVHEHRRH